MSCGCGKRQDEGLAGTTLRQSTSRENPDTGIYDTAAAPGCTESYHGEYARSNVTVYVVDINGPRETFFKRSERDSAVRMARTQRLTLAHVHPANLCHETMVSLFGS